MRNFAITTLGSSQNQHERSLCPGLSVSRHILPQGITQFTDLLSASDNIKKQILPEYKFRDAQLITINERNFIYADEGKHYINAITVENGYYYSIDIGDDMAATPIDYTLCKPIFDGMVRTFQPLSSLSPQEHSAQETMHDTIPVAIAVSDWHTYTNDEFGFSVKYPKNWQYTEYHDQDSSLIVSLYGNKDQRGVLHNTVSLFANIEEATDRQRHSTWEEGIFTGCSITANKKLHGEKSIFFRSIIFGDEFPQGFSSEEKMDSCQSNTLLPEFGAIVNSFRTL